MPAKPQASSREVARVAGVGQNTALRAMRAAPNGAADAEVVGSDGKHYPARVLRSDSSAVAGEVVIPEPTDQEAHHATLLLLAVLREEVDLNNPLVRAQEKAARRLFTRWTRNRSATIHAQAGAAAMLSKLSRLG